MRPRLISLVFGLVTAIIVGRVNAWMTTDTSAFYSATFLGFIPFGAFFSGLIAGSGYFISQKYQHVPPNGVDLLLLIALCIASLLSIYFFIYLDVVHEVNQTIYPFSSFFSKIASSGYVFLFALGYCGGAVLLFHYLNGQSRCITCNRYRTSQEKNHRYTDDEQERDGWLKKFHQVKNGKAATILFDQIIGNYTPNENSKFGMSLETLQCSGCKSMDIRIVSIDKAQDEWEDSTENIVSILDS